MSCKELRKKCRDEHISPYGRKEESDARLNKCRQQECRPLLTTVEPAEAIENYDAAPTGADVEQGMFGTGLMDLVEGRHFKLIPTPRTGSCLFSCVALSKMTPGDRCTWVKADRHAGDARYLSSYQIVSYRLLLCILAGAYRPLAVRTQVTSGRWHLELERSLLQMSMRQLWCIAGNR